MNERTQVQELERVLLDQIEKLNDDSVMGDPEKAQLLIGRSRAMTELAGAYVEINRMKLDIVKELNRGGTIYEKYLGIETGNAGGTK
jgi:hypothetical protein